MTDIYKVDNALSSFHEWSRPWEYIHAVLAQHGLQRADIQLINELWAEVTDSRHWKTLHFEASHESIRQTLKTRYPWVSTNAIDSLIRGASYVWK